MGVVTSPEPRPLSDMDEALYRLVCSALVLRGQDSATVTRRWNAQADMWFVEVMPVNLDAASLSVAFDGTDLLSVMVGRTWFEVFPVRSSEDLGHLRSIAEAVFAGDVEEAGASGRSFARIGSGQAAIHVGHVHLPLPWKARRRRRCAPYGTADDGRLGGVGG
jgi:hypothetical protein